MKIKTHTTLRNCSTWAELLSVQTRSYSFFNLSGYSLDAVLCADKFGDSEDIWLPIYGRWDIPFVLWSEWPGLVRQSNPAVRMPTRMAIPRGTNLCTLMDSHDGPRPQTRADGRKLRTTRAPYAHKLADSRPIKCLAYSPYRPRIIKARQVK